MKTTVEKILTPCIIQVSDAWQFHGVSGTVIRMVGIRGVPQAERVNTVSEMGKILLGKQVAIVEKWFVQGRILHAIIHFQEKPISELFPDRRTYAIEPSRKLSPYDQIPLLRVSGGLPSSWQNPLSRAMDLDTVPYFGEVQSPTKEWNPDYNEQKTLADALYCHERDGIDNQEARFRLFFESPTTTTLVIFGHCGIGKTWFAIHNIVEHRPKNTDFAYIDLRGRPKGAELSIAIHRELGRFLDQYINNSPDPIAALAHYLVPIVRPLFRGKDFDAKGKPEREKMEEAYLKIASDPSNLADYNDVRLGYYDNSGKKLFVVVDNVDNYTEDEQLTVFEYVKRTLLGHEGVRVIIPLRPTSRVFINRLEQASDIIFMTTDLTSPSVEHLLKRRLSRSIHGKALDLNAKLPGTEKSWSKLLYEYLKSDSASLLRDLCSIETDIPPMNYRYRTFIGNRRYDCRHYIRLFRRLLTSNVIDDFENINSEYYAVHALMLRPGEPMEPQSAFLINLFDNDLPDKPGNALVRYRVLEYFHNNADSGALFNAYFRALGPGLSVVRAVTDLFITGGFLVPEFVVDPNTGKQIECAVSISWAGRRHFAVVRNLWYGICVKTGMHVEPGMIKRGDEAKQAAWEEVGVESRCLLDFYAGHGWVSDKDFIEFLFKQEDLESRRIGEIQADSPEHLQVIAGLVEGRSSPAEILREMYGEQLYYWRKKGKAI